jgi:hypothetical protein
LSTTASGVADIMDVAAGSHFLKIRTQLFSENHLPSSRPAAIKSLSHIVLF